MDCLICRSPRKEGQIHADADIISHVEHLARGSIDAVNARQFDIRSPEWSYLASLLTIEFAHPGYRGPRRMPLTEYLEYIEQNCIKWPQYKATLLDQCTTLSEDRDEATIFENVVVEGAPPGVVTKLVIVLGFKLRAAPRVGEEPWRLLDLRSAIGI